MIFELNENEIKKAVMEYLKERYNVWYMENPKTDVVWFSNDIEPIKVAVDYRSGEDDEKSKQ